MKKVQIAIFCLLMGLYTNLFAQTSIKIEQYQDSLVKISNSVLNADDAEKKIAENGRFVKTLVNALKTNNSYNFAFDSLKTVSVIKSPDQSFRIFSWYVAFNDGTYRFFGAIQMKTNNGVLKLIPLLDQTENLKDFNAITTNQNWFGARYYEIIPVKINGQAPYYILLGWKGNSARSTKKVIEILKFNNEMVSFGAPVFDGKEFAGKNRVIFEYNKQNAMTLKSDLKAGMIIYDHLAPYDPKMVGRFEFYGSDLSFDGFKIIGGRLKLQENIDLKNEDNKNDVLYADPTKKLKPEKKF
jgi:hypothetical protein